MLFHLITVLAELIQAGYKEYVARVQLLIRRLKAGQSEEVFEILSSNKKASFTPASISMVN